MGWIGLWLVVFLIGIIIASAGVRADNSNEKEVGGWSIEKYHGVNGLWDLRGPHGNVDQFCNKMAEYGWSKVYRLKDDSAWESDFEDSSRGGKDDIWVDNVDFVYFDGHGGPYGIYFGTDHNSVGGGEHYMAASDEVKWGDKDVEWIVLDACSVLKYNYNGKYVWERWVTSTTFSVGLYVLLGWDSVAVDYASWDNGVKSRGAYLAEYIHQGYTLADAWRKANEDAKQDAGDPSTYTAAIYAAKVVKNINLVIDYSQENPETPYKDPQWYANNWGWKISYNYIRFSI